MQLWSYSLCLQCLCHSLLLIALFFLFFSLFLLVLSITCFVSLVKMKSEMVPVVSTVSILPTIYGVVPIFSISCDLPVNLETVVRPALAMMRPELIEACCY